MGGLSDPSRAEQLTEGIRQLDADVFIGLESYNLNAGFDIRPIASLDYDLVASYSYGDSDPNFMRPGPGMYNDGFLVLSRLATSATAIKHDAGRTTVEVIAREDGQDKSINLRALHLDDRLEQTRLDAVDHVLSGEVKPDLLIGDYNSLNGRVLIAKFIGSRLVGSAAELIPFTRQRSLATRLHRMADGRTVEKLEEAGYVDADPAEQATMKVFKSINLSAVVKLDRAMYRPNSVVVSEHQVHQIGGSDHLPISVDIKPA